MRTGLAVALLGLATLLAGVGLVMLAWAAYDALSASAGPTAARAVVGGGALVIGGGLAWLALRTGR